MGEAVLELQSAALMPEITEGSSLDNETLEDSGRNADL